jgi:uncharacterized protein
MNSRLGTSLKFVVLVFVLTIGPATAQAAAAGDSKPTANASGGQPSREQVLQLMTAMGIQQSVDQSLHQAQMQVKDAARESFLKQNPQANDAATMKKLDDVFDSTPFFKFADVAEVVIPIYQKNLSATDVQAGIDFYTSEAGKRLLEKVPIILHEANEQGGKLVQEKMEAYTTEIERKLTEFQAQLPKPAQSDSGTDKKPAEKPKADEKSK